MKDGLKLKGDVVIETRDHMTGEVLSREEKHNLIVSAGLVQVAKLLGGVSASAFVGMAVGTGTTAPASGNTTLETERKRMASTNSYLATNKAVFTATFDFASGETWAITEAGIFTNATSGGEMLDRFTFSAKNVDWDIDLVVTVTITVS